MPGPSEFLVKLSLGTPSSLYWAIIDTGSDLIWTTCRHCDNCPIQTPVFDPLQSSTYKNQRCFTSFCTILPHNVKLPGIVFGCVHSKGNPNPALLKVLGLVGLSGGPLSLVNQIGSFIDKKFAYCLPPYSNENNSMGQLKFGEDAEFSGREEVQETPMAPGGSQGTYYVLNLTDISVGGNRLNIQFGGSKTTAFLGDARSIIIDSGTTLTFLAMNVYGQVVNVVANVINHEHFYRPEKDLLC
ncbi:aspartic proteinase CDR1-like [Nymphaea colorata]|uniref:aspartic proteinase CDR1-like n=1 Tax=Nymphaea colorata TaxID=210225 RepID=UPI00129DF561|nr:aspartic proteinase CDR1-like [Nymphaea colorata]